MVKALSAEARTRINQAVKEAESRCHAKIAIVVAPASDAYQSYVMLYGLALGSLVSLALWLGHLVSDFPLLLLVQTASMGAASFLPPLRHICLRLAPRRALHHRAAHRAFEEYMILSRHVSKEMPFVLFYVSLAERYGHILPSHAARDKVAHAEWEKIITGFTAAMKTISLENACMQAVDAIAERLAG